MNDFKVQWVQSWPPHYAPLDKENVEIFMGWGFLFCCWRGLKEFFFLGKGVDVSPSSLLICNGIYVC